MMSKKEFANYLSLDINDKRLNWLYTSYMKARKYDALVQYGVDNWEGYEDALQSLDNEISNNN